MPVTSYSRTPASNNSAAPNGWPEGQTPGSLNNCARQMMTDIVNEASKGAAKVLGTVAGTNTITAVMSPALDAYSAGMQVVLTPAATNTSTVTLNIDSKGALDIFKPGGTPLDPGDLVIGVPAVLVLDSGADDWILLNPPFLVGTFTGTLTGFSVNPTGTISYTVSGRWVTLTSDIITGTSNAATMTMTGMPAAIRPGVRRICFDGHLYDNSASNPTLFGRADVATTGTITFATFRTSGVFDSSGFTASGTKGIHDGWHIRYPLY